MPLKYAAPWRRGAAFLLDAVVVAAPVGWAVSAEAGAAAGAAVSALCTMSGWQRTPGKALLGLRTMEHEGRRVGPARALAREGLKYAAVWAAWRAGVMAGPGACWLVSAWWLAAPLALAVVTMQLDRRRRGWWDRICGTSVISLPQSEVKAEEETPDRA